MYKCQKCGAPMNDTFTFCGRCGAHLKERKTVIIDGDKNKWLKRIIGNVLYSKKKTAVMLAAWLIILVAGILLLKSSLQTITSGNSNLHGALAQLTLKSKYLKEGLPLGYIKGELFVVIDTVSDWIYLCFGGFIISISLFFAVYYSYHIIRQMKYNTTYYAIKSVTLNKISVTVGKVASIIAIIFLLLIIAPPFIKFIIGVFYYG